ncbi:MAG: GMC family oxidoreductase [Candidatus Tokpelaia sp.]|nr:MAG: GMC family oxidoreductase [Candidatus Tokpelaia sp.]KAA6206355.1 MAG: GMC family oxidoreductase [Candidatus Tokpelaia sp.]
MAIQQKKKNVVIVGLGWTGSIVGLELAREGYDVLAIERGHDRNIVPNWSYPTTADELKYALRLEEMEKLSNTTVTIRRSLSDTALPYRQLGSFLIGTGVGGCGAHWNCQTWRAHPEEFHLRSYVEKTFGEQIIPEDMTIQDWGVSYNELEPYYDFFEKVAGVAGEAGNIKGHKTGEGNPFEAWRSNTYPMPGGGVTYHGKLFAQAAKSLGYHPFAFPAAIATQSYTNPYGMQMGPCNYCGYCERFGCLNYSKGSPQMCALAAAKRHKNFQYITRSEVLRIEKSANGETVSGVTYIDPEGREIFQPADMVVLASFQMNNVRLLLHSALGQPYNPQTNEGVIGRNYAYQINVGSATAFFKDKNFNPFIGTGANCMALDDFATNRIDFAKEGFIGGVRIDCNQTNGQPNRSLPLPTGTPAWGAGWKQAIGDWYGRNLGLGLHGSCMSYRDAYLDLDPTYKDKYGRPLMRMTFNWHENDIKLAQFGSARQEEIVKALNPDSYNLRRMQDNEPYDATAYQTTHTVGGAIMGENPQNSALNRYLQHWDYHNLFVPGANAYPQNLEQNPTGTVGALTYWMVAAIKNNYLKNPRPLV